MAENYIMAEDTPYPGAWGVVPWHRYIVTSALEASYDFISLKLSWPSNLPTVCIRVWLGVRITFLLYSEGRAYIAITILVRL
jgi:hypothetical protein